MPLPAPYRYSEYDFLAIPDKQNGGYRYMRQPIDTRSGQLVSEELANQLLHDNALYDELLTELPPEFGLVDEGGRKVTNWDVVLRQRNGNVVTIPIVTGGFAQVRFPRTAEAKAVAVLTPDLMNLLLGGTLSVEQISGMDPAALLVQQFTQANPAQLVIIGDILRKAGLLCTCTTGDNGDTYVVIDLLELVDDTSATTPTNPTNPANPTNPTSPATPKYRVRVDKNDCFIVSGWSVNEANTGVPAPVRIAYDGVTVANVTPKNVRPDVAKYLREQLGLTAADTSLFGWEWIVPETYRKGVAHKTTVFAADTAVEAEVYNEPQTTGTCGSTPTTTPRVVQRVIGGPASLTPGQNKRYSTTEQLEDTTERKFTGQAVYSVDGGLPDGLNLVVAAGGAEVDLIYSGGKGQKITLRGTYPGGGQATLPIQLVSSICVRPGGQDYKPQLVYAYAPASGGNAKTFDTLEEANRVMGRHFDGTEPMIFTPFPAEMANYNVGTQVYWKWNSESTACEFVSNNIYAVLGGQGQNDQKLAIQVVDTRIVAQKASDYVTQPAIDPNNRVTEIAVTTTTLSFTQTPNPGDNVVDCFALFQVIGKPVVWAGTYIVHRDAPDQTFKLLYDGITDYTVQQNSNKNVMYDLTKGPPADGRLFPYNQPFPAEWSRMRFLAGVNTQLNEYRVRIDLRLNGPTGPLLISYGFETGLPMLPLKTIYLNR